MAQYDELMQRALTVRNNVAPSSNTALLVGGVLVSIVSALQQLLDDKQDALTFDTTPTDGSTNPVTSDGIFEALAGIDLSACEKIINKVTSIDAQSTDVQYPSAKLLYNSLQALANIYAPKVHTHPFAAIEHPATVASVTAQGYTITIDYYSHVLTITADATLHLPAMQSGAAIILRLTIIQDATGGRTVTFDGGAALVYNPYQADLSLGQANERCFVLLWFDGVNWAWMASPYVLRADSQFAYSIDGTSGGQYVTITINGTTMQIDVLAGVWQYGYNTPITSLAFTGDTGVLSIDFTNSDTLAGVTSLNDCFKNCSALVAVDFTGCDLSSVATAADCFAGCIALASLTIPTGTWKPDIDLSASTAINKAAMLSIIDGLYTYSSGTHTVTFNSTIWDALSQADQQQVSTAASAKGWTTNAVAVAYVVSGTSSNVNGTETFYIQFINDGSLIPSTQETILCSVDSNGFWDFSYIGKKIYSLQDFAKNNTTVLSISFEDADDLSSMIKISSGGHEFALGATALKNVSFKGKKLENVSDLQNAFRGCSLLESVDFSDATFDSLTVLTGAFYECSSLLSMDFSKANFSALTGLQNTFYNCRNIVNISFKSGITLPNVTSLLQAFYNCQALKALSLPSPTFANCTTIGGVFYGCNALELVNFDSATFNSNTVADNNSFAYVYALTTFVVPNSATFNRALNLRFAPLTYQSILNIANWVYDLTGNTAKTVTFKTSAWNALSSAEQTTIDGILSAKNWTRALAN